MATSKARWKNPKSLININKKVNPYPVDALGPILGEAARDIADLTQAPVGVVAQSVLAAATLAAHAHADVLVDGNRYPISNLFITVAPSGERKSAVNEIVMREIKRHEDRLHRQFDENMRAHGLRQAQASTLPGRRRTTKSDDGPVLPIIVLQDVTYDGIADSLLKGYPAPGIYTDEGATFIGGRSMSAEQLARTAGGICTLWDGKLAPRLRKGRNSPGHKGCRVSMLLMVQPPVAEDFFAHRFLWDQGFFPRCLMIDAPGLAGTRAYKARQAGKLPSIRAYHRQIKRLMLMPLPMVKEGRNALAPRSLTLTKLAKKEWIQCFNDIEKRLGEGGRYEHIPGVGSRAPQQILRIAGVLTMIGNPLATKIKVAEIVNARRLVTHYLWHARRFFSAVHVSEKMVWAKEVLEWLRNEGMARVTLQQEYQLGPVRKAGEARAAMRVLETYGWVKQCRVEGKEGFKINPKLFSEGS